jgi:hypothetical protein
MKKVASARSQCQSIRLRQGGMALVIVLSLVVLVTVSVVAFFTRATSNRVLSASRTNRGIAGQIAETGADYALEMFLTNAAPGNTNITIPILGNGVIYQDANLVMQSLPGADPYASTNNTSTPSRNGFFLSKDRWSMPCLLTNNSGFPDTNSLPSWIYVNQDGSLSATPSNTTIGRFAYNAYDIGGLLDINVAGYLTGTPSDDLQALKGTLAGADVSLIGIDPDALVAWRNSGSLATNSKGYVGVATDQSANGFLTPLPGDRAFLTRQDLINAASNGVAGITPSSLPYLTHFTRELARPSVPAATNANAQTAMTNRYCIGALNSSSDLDQLDGALTDGIEGFRKIMQRGITWSVNSKDDPMNSFRTDDGLLSVLGNSDQKSLNITANLISQFSGDRLTVPVTLDSKINSGYRALGKSDYPYLGGLYALYNFDATAGDGSFAFNFSMIPELWAPTGINLVSPNSLQASLAGGTVTLLLQAPTDTQGNPIVDANGHVQSPWDIDPTTITDENPNGLPYTDNSTGQPFTDLDPTTYSKLIQGMNGFQISLPSSDSRPLGTFDSFNDSQTTPNHGWSAKYLTTDIMAGLFLQSISSPALPSLMDSTGSTITIPVSPYTFSVNISATDLSFTLGGNAPYTSYGQDQNDSPVTTLHLDINYSSGDPAPSSVNTAQYVAGIAVGSEDARTWRNGGQQQPYGFSQPITSLSLPVTSDSLPYPSKIQDPYSPQEHRFNTAGDLGMIFHEDPWRTIDFISNTNNNADWQLLDLLTVLPTPPSGIRAGVVNLNTKHPEVLACILAGTVTTQGQSLDANASTNIATELVRFTTLAPMEHRAALVNFILTSTNLASAPGVKDNGPMLKHGLEAPIRALSEVGQTRTWNLLIDVVAQSGKFPKDAQGPPYSAGDFVVGGQDRIWVSVAIDRITGQVIDRKAEVVKE